MKNERYTTRMIGWMTVGERLVKHGLKVRADQTNGKTCWVVRGKKKTTTVQVKSVTGISALPAAHLYGDFIVGCVCEGKRVSAYIMTREEAEEARKGSTTGEWIGFRRNPCNWMRKEWAERWDRIKAAS